MGPRGCWVAAVAAFGAACCWTAECQSDRQVWNPGADVMFGQTAALSGGLQELGNAVRIGITAAFHAWNNAMKQKISVGLISYDDEYIPDNAMINSEQLLRNEGAFGLVGTVGTGTSRAVLPVLKQEMAVLLGPITGATPLRTEPSVINVRASYQDEMYMFIDYFVKKRFMSRVSIFAQSDVNVQDMLQEVLKTTRMTIFSYGSYERGTMDIEAGLEHMKAVGEPEVVIIGGAPQPLALFVHNASHAWKNAEYALISFGTAGFGPSLAEYERVANETREMPFVFLASVVENPPMSESTVVRAYQRAVRSYASTVSDPENVTNMINRTETLEGYVAGRLAVDVLGRAIKRDTSGLAWNFQNVSLEGSAADPEALSDFKRARQLYVNTVYDVGFFNVDGLNLGPYKLGCDVDYSEDINLSNSVTMDECFCTQGMHKVFANQFDKNGIQVRYSQGDFEFTNCGEQSTTNRISFGHVGDPDVKTGVEAALSYSSRIGTNPHLMVDIVSCADGSSTTPISLLGNIGSNTEEPPSCISDEVARNKKVLQIGMNSGSRELRVPFNKSLVNVRVSILDEILAIVYYLAVVDDVRNVSVVYDGNTAGTDGFLDVVYALSRVGLRAYSQGEYSVANASSCDQGEVADNTSLIAALDNLTSLGQEPPEAILLLGNCTRYLAAFVELARTRTPWDGTTFVTLSTGSEALARQLRTKENRQRFMATQVVPLPTDTSFELVKNYRKDLEIVANGSTPSFCGLEGYVVGRLAAAMLASVPVEITRLDLLHFIYNGTQIYHIDDFVLGPYSATGYLCNQGMRTIYFTVMEDNGTFGYAPLLHNLTFSTPGTVACGNWTGLGCAMGLHQPDGSDICVRCPPATYIECDAECQSKPGPDQFHNYGAACLPCAAGKYGIGQSMQPGGSGQPYTDTLTCVSCAPGRYTAEEGQSACILCPDGHFPVNGGTECQPCSAGTEPRIPFSEGAPPCERCAHGRFSAPGTLCVTCPDGTYSGASGATECETCSFGWTHSPRRLHCQPDPLKVIVCVGIIILGTLTLLLLTAIAVWRTPILDLALLNGSVVIDTHGRHFVMRLWQSRISIQLVGTGNPSLDNPPKPFRVRVITPGRLELLTADGKEVNDDLATSIGAVRCRFPWMCVGFGIFNIPFSVIAAVCVIVIVAAFNFLARPPIEYVILFIGISALLYLAIIMNHLRSQMTPLAKKVEAFSANLKRNNPELAIVSPGPGRAVSLSQLHSLWTYFQAWIGNRDMYYVVANLVKPVTRKYQLSYAEVAGPSPAVWFVSHAWCGQFHHLVTCIKAHASNIAKTGVAGVESSSIVPKASIPPDTQDDSAGAYWICSLSSNQWRAEEGPDTRLQDRAFYRTLNSSGCVGTALILDGQAVPLKRCWCLFEVLQTVLHMSENEQFVMLLCTANGVLNFGVAHVDVAVAIAHKLSTLRVEDASATEQEDKDMIIKELGIKELGITEVNLFLRSIFREVLVNVKNAFDKDYRKLEWELEQEKEDADGLRGESTGDLRTDSGHSVEEMRALAQRGTSRSSIPSKNESHRTMPV